VINIIRESKTVNTGLQTLRSKKQARTWKDSSSSASSTGKWQLCSIPLAERIQRDIRSCVHYWNLNCVSGAISI